MRTYELVMVYDPGLEVEQIENDLRKLNDTLTTDGLVRRWERWGKRRLTYEIKGRQYGYYVLAVFDSNPAAVAELERGVRINPIIIRHLVTVVDPKRVPEPDPESVRTLGAAPGAAPEAVPVEIVPGAELPVELPIDPDVIAPGPEITDEPEPLV
jgi:small subunit ribosomal protein S6